MKKINIIFSTISIVILVFSLILFLSCNKGKTEYNDTTKIRPCDNVICLNGGTCTDGLCYCPQGFEGPKCEARWSDKFVGNYATDDECDTSANFYNMVINADASYAYKLRLYNLGKICQGKIIEAIINPEKTSFTIPIQNTCGNFYLSGNGNINGSFINVYLISRDTVNHTGTQCSLILNKI